MKNTLISCNLLNSVGYDTRKKGEKLEIDKVSPQGAGEVGFISEEGREGAIEEEWGECFGFPRWEEKAFNVTKMNKNIYSLGS